MYKHNLGLTPFEDIVVAIFRKRIESFDGLFYDSAIPLKELFYFFIIAGNTPKNFNRVPSVVDVLKTLGIIKIEKITTDDIEKLKRTIRSNSKCEIITSLNQESNFAVIRKKDKSFEALDNKNKRRVLTASELRKEYNGYYYQIKSNDNKSYEWLSLYSKRIFKPEKYIPFHFVEEDIVNICELQSRIDNLLFVYIVFRRRMYLFYKNCLNIELSVDVFDSLEGFYQKEYKRRNKAKTTKDCYCILQELEAIDHLIMSELKERLGV